MTFSEQILGIPPELVEHGWRREPPRAVQLAWHDDRVTDPNRLQRWSTCFIRVDGESLEIWRPEVVGTYSNATAVYSHAGWGDGLAPTPEMCKVWLFWWIDGCPSHVNVLPNGFIQHSEPYRLGAKYADASTKYNGPVLPPVRQS